MGKFDAKTYAKAYVKFKADDMDIDKDDMKKMKEYMEEECELRESEQKWLGMDMEDEDGTV